MNKSIKSNQDVPMSRRRAKLLADYANRLAEMLENAPDDKDLAEWVQSKIDRAASAIQSAYHYLEHDELEKGAGHKYIRRIPKGRDKRTGRMRYDYVYKEHHRGGLRAAVEDLKAGEAFKLKDPSTGQDGHFHVKAVKGSVVVVEHDETGRSVTMTKSELKALLMKEHGQALKENFQAKKETYERMKRDTPKHIGLKAAFNRLQAAADKAGIKLPATARERYASWYKEQAENQEPNKEVGALMRTPEPPAQGQHKPLSPKFFAAYRRKLNTDKERLRHLKNIYEHPHNPSRLNRPNEMTTELYAEVKANLLEDIKELEDQTGEHTFKQPANSKELFTRVKRFFPEIETIYDRGITATIKVKAGQVKGLKSKLIKHPTHPIQVTGNLLRGIHLRDLIEILRGEENKAAYQAQSKDNFETMPEPAQEPAQAPQPPARAQLIETATQEPAQPAKIDNFELAEHTHTKTGVKLFTAKQKDRVDRDEFKRRVQIAKKYKGRYDSRYAKAYLFKNAEDARKFALEVEGKPTDSTAPATNNFETMPEAESVDNFETMPEVESGTAQRLKEAHSLLKESLEKDEIKNGRRARASINADKKLIEHIQKIIDNDFKDIEHPDYTPFQDRTPKQNVLMEMRGSLSHLKNEQRLLRGSRQNHEDIQRERNKSRRSLRTALNNLEKLSASNFETMPESKPKLDEDRKTAQAKAVKRLKRALSLVKKAERLDHLKNNRRSKAAKEADQALIAQVQHILENHLTDIDINATRRKPYTMWTRDETLKMGLHGSIGRLADKQKALSTAYGGAKAAHEYRSDLRARLQDHLQDYLDRFISSEEIDARLDRELAAQQKEQAQADRHIQQVSFREDIQQKLDSTRIATDPESIFRLNKKGEIYGLKQQGYLYTNQTRENKLAHNINAEAESYLNVRSIQELIENAVANKQTPTELKQEIGKLIDEEQRKSASAAPRRIRTEIYETHNRQTSAAKNLKGIIYNTDAIGLESIKNQTQDYTLKSNLSIYGAADSVLNTQERAQISSESLVGYSYLLSQRYTNIADVRANAEKVKADIEQIGRRLLELLKQRTENHYQRTADQIEKAAAELRKNKLNEQRLRALIVAAEKKAEILTPEEKTGHDREIADLKQNLDEVLRASAENANQAANWYENEARLTLKAGAKATLGGVTDAIEKEGGNQLHIRTPKGTAKEKLLDKMFNEVLGRLVQESRNTPLDLPSSIQGDLKSTTESKPKEPQLISRQKEKTEQTIRKIDRERERLKEAAAQEKKEGHVYEKASQSLTKALVKRTTQDGKILNLGMTTDQNIKHTIINAFKERAGTVKSEYVSRMLSQAIGGNFESYLGPQITKRAADTLLKEVKEAYSTGKPVEQAEREAQEAIQKALKFNLSRLIDRKVRGHIQPRPAESYKLKDVEFTDRRSIVKDRRFNKFSAGTARSADPYNRIAAEYNSSKQLEAAKDTIKEKTKEAYRQIAESWSDYQLDELRRKKADIDTTPAGIQRRQVIPAFKKLLSDLGIENESGSNDGKISLMAQLDNLQAITLESAQAHDAEAKAKQAHVNEMFRRYNAKIDELRNDGSKRQAQAAYLERNLADTYESGKLSKRGAMVREYQREAIRELTAELKAQSGPRISKFGENLDQRETVNLEPAPARAQLIETASTEPTKTDYEKLMPQVAESGNGSLRHVINKPFDLKEQDTSGAPTLKDLSDRSRFPTLARQAEHIVSLPLPQLKALANEVRAKLIPYSTELKPLSDKINELDTARGEAANKEHQLRKKKETLPFKRRNELDKKIYQAQLAKDEIYQQIFNAKKEYYEKRNKLRENDKEIETASDISRRIFIELRERAKAQAPAPAQAPTPAPAQAPQPPARAQLIETTDQSAESAAVRITPSLSEERLTNYSSELNPSEIAQIYDRSRFLTVAKETPTKTLMRSKKQRAIDNELILMHQRLDIHAGKVLGPLKPRVTQAHKYGPMFNEGTREPEHREKIRAKIKADIQKLYRALNPVKKSAHSLINYRAAIYKALNGAA